MGLVRNDNYICVGDSVQIHVGRQHGVIEGIVTDKPPEPGGAWKIRTGNGTNDVIYVQQYVTLRRIEPLENIRWLEEQ